jgi:hypothetical protein
MKDLIHIPEPRLLFRHNQATEDPRDGLFMPTLFLDIDESGFRDLLVATLTSGKVGFQNAH